jgi:hypothetical protein
MPDELGTKDVLDQVHVRLGNVEQDLRAFRTEMNDRFAELRTEMNAWFGGVDQRFMWIYGLLVAVLLSVTGLWFK